MIACYCRVSTADQNLDRQLTATSEYAQDRLGAEIADIGIYQDKSTGANTSRDGYQDLMDAVEAGKFEAVIVHDLTRMSRSLQDLEATVDRVTSAGAELHFVRDALAFEPTEDDEPDPLKRLQMQMLGAFSEWEARVKRLNTREGIAARREEEGYHHGRPPLGFEKDNGHLIEGPEYDQVVAVLDMVLKGDLSKRRSARELGTSRPTIDRALDRAMLYGL